MKIPKCHFCGSEDVPETEVDLFVGANVVKSIKVLGAKCHKCGEEYYDTSSMKIAEEIRKMEDETAVGA